MFEFVFNDVGQANPPHFRAAGGVQCTMFRTVPLLLSLLVVLPPLAVALDGDRILCRPRTGAAAYAVLMACTRVVAMRDIPAEERARAYYSRAGAHKHITSQGRAIADYSEAINHAPNFVDAYLERANLFLLERDFRAALADCLTVIGISPTLDLGHWCAARAYAGSDETRRALSAVRRAFRWSREHATDRVLSDLFPSEPGGDAN